MMFLIYFFSYLQPPVGWIKAELESKTLLSLCLKKMKGLNKVNFLQYVVILCNQAFFL